MVQKENESIRDAECMSSLKENKQISVHYEQSYLERISWVFVFFLFTVNLKESVVSEAMVINSARLEKAYVVSFLIMLFH